jgi:hypothetical protein
MTFLQLFHSGFSGLINATLYDRFFENLNPQLQWYEILLEKGDCQVSPIVENGIKARVSAITGDMEKRGHHTRYDWFYTNNVELPDMVKIYNPLLCGCSGGESKPWIVLSSVKPEDEEIKQLVDPPKKKSLKENIICKLNEFRKG